MAVNKDQEEWLRHMGLLDDRSLDRSQFEQQWPMPMSVDKSLPKPWYVAAYSGAALGNVLRSDYGEMAGAAACYAAATCKVGNLDARELRDRFVADFWPWARSWWKPQERRRNLVKAAALIIAEIERLDRASEKSEAA